MNKFISIKPDRCISCGTCLAECSESHGKVGLQREPRLHQVETLMVSAAVTCHHCEGAPCLQVCPVNAITRVDDSIRINEQTCIGCKLCAVACPFGAITPSGTSVAGVAGVAYGTPSYSETLNPILRYDIGVMTRAIKCDLCYFDEKGPNCVRACPTHALELVDAATIVDDITERREDSAEAMEAMMKSNSKIRRP